MSIVTFEKPVPKVAESDWNYKVYELKESCDNHRLDAFELRNESHRLRNDTDVTTYWSTHHTNSEIIDRRAEITRWKDLIEILYKKLQKEIEDIKNEKNQTEKVLEFLNLNFTITNHCLSIRDERGGADLCHDIVSVELKNEQHNLEKLKQLLTEICQIAWEQMNKLEELRINVAEDLDNKINTISIDTELLDMTKNSPNISLKPDPLRVPKDFSTYEKWLQHCSYIRRRIENELVKSKKLRETMYIPRDKAKNDLRARNDSVNFGLRRRIYDTDRIKDELEWQKYNMQVDKEKFLIEIVNLENALDRKLNSKMLVDTRCEERLYRTGAELCHDKTTVALHKEYFQLDHTTQILTDKLNQTKAMHNILTEQMKLIDEELINKTHALGVDQKCLEYRTQLQNSVVVNVPEDSK